MSKNLKATNNLAKIRNFLLAVTIIVAMLVGFGLFYEQNFLDTQSWSLMTAYIAGSILIYAWLVWLVATLAPIVPFIQGKKLLIVAIDCIICAIIVIIVKNLIMPLIPNPTVTSWDMLVAGLLFFVAFCCVTADYLKRLL